MNEAALEAWFADCGESLQSKNDLLELRYGIGSFARWHHDGEAGTLTFFNQNDDARLIVKTTTIGTFSLKTETWMWGWANESHTDADRDRSTPVQSLADETGLRLFREPHIDCDEVLAWELAAAGARHLDAIGIYRGPSGHLWTFWSIDRVASTD